jgi:hypothetical protein
MGLGWSIHRNGGWHGQYERMIRWHQRVIRAALTGSSDLEDFALVFFQVCYHLRDWMIETGGATRLELDRLFAESMDLRVCRDICNGAKHLNITRPSVDAGFSIGREYAPYEPTNVRLFVIAGAKHDLLELAARCVDAWRVFAERTSRMP